MTVATELEFESELEYENENELELASELESELGLAYELVSEFELEHELEAEHEAFFNHLAAMADRGGRSQALRRIALAAARSALRNQARPWPVIEGESELGELETELQYGSGFGEMEYELEFEATPAQLAQFVGMMEHAGHAAAEAANEQEAAEHFLPLIGLAAKFVLPKLAGLAAKKLGGVAAKKLGGQLIRKVAPRLIRRAMPQLTRGVANISRTLYRNRTTRKLLPVVPRIARGTIYRLGKQIASGKRITPQQAVRTLAQQTVRTLSNPKVLAKTYKRSRALDRRYHQRTRRILGRPTGIPVRAASGTSLSSTPGVSYPGNVSTYSTPYGTMTSPTLPGGAYPGYGGVAVPTTGGCRCTCQPVANASPWNFNAAMPAAAVMPQPAPTCPTCGR